MRYLRITSTANRHIMNVLRMDRQKTSGSVGQILIEGPHLIEMALDSGVQLKEVFAADSLIADEHSSGLLHRIRGTAATVFEVTDQVLRKISKTESPQGILATASYKLRTIGTLDLQESPLLIIADGIQDPGNLGSMIRTADAAGADALIILPGTCDPISDKVIRSTAGSLFNIQIAIADTEELVGSLDKRGIRLVSTAADAEVSVFDADLTGPTAFAFGNEGSGLSDRIRAADGIQVKIPITGRAESLNVAASAAICIYEAVRQRSRRP